MASPRALAAQTHQESFVRRREDPFFDGLLKRDDQAFTFDFRGSTSSQNIPQSILDKGDTRRDKLFSYTSEKFMETPLLEDSVTNVGFELFEKSSSEKFSKAAITHSFVFSSNRLDLSHNLGNSQDSINESGASTLKTDEGYKLLLSPSKPTIDKTYVVNRRKVDLSSIPLPQSAASFYNGISPQMEVIELCESTSRLHSYLKARKDEVNAGVPGRFLHAVISQDVSDVGSVVATIMYAFYLNETQKTGQFCTVPVINMKRADLDSHTDLKWLLDSCQIDETSLIFVDEIDLSYYDLFGGLNLVLINGQKLPAKQEALKDAVVEILTCKKGRSAYPWVEIVTKTEDCSCCTIVAEKFALTSPEILVGQGLSRFLLAGILLDSQNLTNPLCSSKDKYMATLLIHGAGRLGCNGLYQILRYKNEDVSDLKVVDILRKDFRKWTRLGKLDSDGSKVPGSQIGMSSITISVGQLLSRESTATQEIKYFQKSEKLRLLMIVSGYKDSKTNFKRDILVSAESVELMKNLLLFFNSNATNLLLQVLHRPGLTEEMGVFEIDKVISRKTIEHLLEEFGGTLKA